MIPVCGGFRCDTWVSVVQVQQDCLQDGVGVGVDQDDVVLQDG